MKKLLSILILCVLITQSAFAVPADLWQEDERVESLYSTGLSEKQEIDMLQKLLDYLGIIDKTTLNHTADTTKDMFLGAFAQILGFGAEDTAAVEAQLRPAYIRAEDKLSRITFDTALYACMIATGYAEIGYTKAECYRIAQREDLLYNLVYESNRAMTQREFVQLIFNAISAPVLTAEWYAYDGGTFSKDEGESILESKWGITMRRGVVDSVYGESIYPANSCEWGDIYINDVYHKYNPAEPVEGLVGRECVYFVDEDDNLVLFAEADTYNDIIELAPYSDFNFKADSVDYYVGDKEKTERLTDDVKVIYNGVFAGQYSKVVADTYISDDSKVTLIDNDSSNGVDILIIERYYSYPVEEVGAEGVIKFKYDMLYHGLNYIDALPDDNNVHVDVYVEGIRTDFSEVKFGAVVSIADSVNVSGHTYTKIIADCESVSDVLSGTIDDDTYIIGDTEYSVSGLLRDAQASYDEITVPTAGKEYTFTLDVSGTVADVSYVSDLKWGYLVRAGYESNGLNKTAKVKIFTEDGNMVTYETHDEPILHYKDNLDGTVCTPEQFCSLIKGKKEDYRALVKFKATAAGVLKELYLPITNNDLETEGPGTIDYEVTKDYTYTGTAGMYYYNGVADYMYYFPASAPCFCVPSSFDADDIMYQVKQASAWGNTNTPMLELYSMDEFGVVGAGLMYDDGDDYTLNATITVVDKIGSGLNAEGDTKRMIYGWQNGKEVKLPVMKDNLTSQVFGDYEGLSVSSLKFGDLIQVNMLNGEVAGFRVIYKVSNPPVNGGIWRYTGAARTSSNLAGHSRFEAAVGTLKAKKGSNFTAELEVSDKMRTICFYGSSALACYVIDKENETITKVASPEMNMYLGTQIVIQKNWSNANNVFLYK